MNQTIDRQNIRLLANTIRVLSAEAVQKANSGHPGMPMGTADLAAVLWSYFLQFNPKQPDWTNRDRFVLSAGHGSMLLYSLLHLFGFDLPLSEIENFRQWHSKTPGHPEFGETVGVETTTGPLGQGFGNGVGLALSSRMLAARYDSKLFLHRVFGIVSDGDLMEGVASEAASLAGHWGLSNLTYLYDQNQISIGGSTDICFTESVAKRFEGYGWFVQSIDGHSVDEIVSALQQAEREQERPSLICARTTIAWGSPNKAGTADSHGSPLGAEEIVKVKQFLEWPSEEPFFVPAEVKDFCNARLNEKVEACSQWTKEYQSWTKSQPEKARQFSDQTKRQIPETLSAELIARLGGGKKSATRELCGEAIQVIAKSLPGFVGGSADLEPSNKTLIKNGGEVQASDFSGRNLRFGVREHGMGAIANGLAYTQSWIPYTATFLVFSDYMRPAIRIAAIAKLQTLFIFSHDSFYVGEDGPTHQPIEHITSLRAIPNLNVLRPADGLEVAACFIDALENQSGPSALLFTRQGVPALERERETSLAEIRRGGYVLTGSAVSDLVICATGSEVSLAVQVAAKLAASNQLARVVSLPSVENFLAQDKSYRESIIPPQSKRVVIEAGSTYGWERVVGSDALLIGIDNFGASAPAGVLAEQFGFVADNISKRISSFCGTRN